MTNLESVVKDIDWALLRTQKMYLWNEENNNPEVGRIYGGVVNLIDFIQDAAVADGLATAEEVFGQLTKTKPI